VKLDCIVWHICFITKAVPTPAVALTEQTGKRKEFGSLMLAHVYNELFGVVGPMPGGNVLVTYGIANAAHAEVHLLVKHSVFTDKSLPHTFLITVLLLQPPPMGIIALGKESTSPQQDILLHV
jgi:hypothetical protein